MKQERSATTLFHHSVVVCIGLMLAVFILESNTLTTNANTPQGDVTTFHRADLNLPGNPVSYRMSRRHFNVTGSEPQVLADLQGPGCIRRLWIAGNNVSRDVLIRIYFDGVEVPYVEAPLPDFFGLMHNYSHRPIPYTMNTPFLAIKPWIGLTSYFDMPFAENARIELVGTEDQQTSTLYYYLEWQEFPGQEFNETRRFAARWRRESPVQDMADEFIILDADGPGQLLGFVYSVDMLHDQHHVQGGHRMRWSHAGADNIYIDGQTHYPSYHRGLGGEDTFGTGFAGGDYPQQSSLFSDMPYYHQKVPETRRQKIVAYRFFAPDPIHFRNSIHFRFAARAHDVAATVYWYTETPVRPYYEMPPRDQRLPGSEVLRGEYDLPTKETGEWWVTGPFPPGPFEHDLPSEGTLDPEVLFYGKEWQRYESIRGFVDFNHIYRPYGRGVMHATAVALTTLDSPYNTTARITIGYKNIIALQVNDQEVNEFIEHAHVRGHTVEIPLREGENVISLWLSNNGREWSPWAFSFHAETEDGVVLTPRVKK